MNVSEPFFTQFLQSVKKYFPRWEDTREELLVKLNDKIAAIQCSPSDDDTPVLSEEQAIALYSHLLRIRPKSALSDETYWLIVDSMQKGIIDCNYQPNCDFEPIDEDKEKLDKIRGWGGEKAVAEYQLLMGEYEKIADDPVAVEKMIDSIGNSLFEEQN